jgi:DNA-directed RNA polymerase specialized sigma24 family protein
MENFKSVFSESYQSLYCRAKSIMSKEEDVIALMKEVYLLAAEANVADVNAKAWMTKQIYTLGCGKFRKKKAREAEIIELLESEYETGKGIDADKTKELICETFTELPDLYHALLVAFYMDRYSVKELATIMGYNVGVIINRLNYIHKYLSKKLEDYQEEHKVKVQFSVEMLYEALKQWAADNTMDETVSQNLYTSLCKELDLPVETLVNEVDESDDADVSDKVQEEESENGIDAVKEELQNYSVKKGLDKKQVVLIAAIVGGLTVLALIAILVLGNGDKKEEPKDNKPPVEQNEDDLQEDDVQEGNTQEDEIQDDEVQEDEVQDDETQDQDTQVEKDSTYILPDSNSRKLTRADLQGLSKEKLRLARNEIFARHGMIFGVPVLDAYFGEKSWYKPTYSYDDFYDKVEMSAIEEANVALINQVEEAMQ